MRTSSVSGSDRQQHQRPFSGGELQYAGEGCVVEVADHHAAKAQCHGLQGKVLRSGTALDGCVACRSRTVLAGVAGLHGGEHHHGGRLAVDPVSTVLPLCMPAAAAIERIEVHAHVARLPRQIAQRMDRAARFALPAGPPIDSRLEVCPEDRVDGPGGAIVLRAMGGGSVLGAGRVAQRGVSAESLGQQAGQALAEEMRSGSTVDVHGADQLPVLLALARGRSEFRISRISSHASTVMWLVELLTSARCGSAPAGDGTVVHVLPSG